MEIKNLPETLRRMAYARRNTPHVVANTSQVEAVLIREAEYLEEAAELLEAQEPKVMTLEEAYNAELVWYDQINTGVRPAKVIRAPNKTGVYRVMRFGDIDAWEHAYEYGEFWRCWTSRPTNEQREATPWTNEEEANT